MSSKIKERSYRTQKYEYIKAVSCLRFLAFWELIIKFNQQDYLSRQGFNIFEMLKTGKKKNLIKEGCKFCKNPSFIIAINQLGTELNQSERAYHALRRRDLCICAFFPKSVVRTFTDDCFIDNFTFSPKGISLKESIRRKWEHSITLGEQTLYFCNSTDFKDIIKRKVLDYLVADAETAIEHFNKLIFQCFHHAKIDNCEVDGSSLREALGYKYLTSDDKLVDWLWQQISNKKASSSISTMLEKYDNQDEDDLLMANEYLERLAGKIKLTAKQQSVP